MVSLVILSHSRQIAEGTRELAMEMAAEAAIYAVGGTSAGTLGADYDSTKESLERAAKNGEVIVLADMGSTRMTAQMALEELEPELQERVHLSNAALVEGSVIAAVTIAADLPVEAVLEQLKEFDLQKD